MKSNHKNIVSTILPLVIWILILETLLRLVPSPLQKEFQNERFNLTHKLSQPFTGPHPTLGRWNIPNANAVVHRSEYTMEVHINSKGLRGPEKDYAKAPGILRVLMLGDSFTFGTGVEENESFVSLLQQKLPHEMEIINGSAPGSSTQDVYRFLTLEGVRYSPDAVILCFFQNDIQDNFQQALDARQIQSAARASGFKALSYKVLAKAGGLLENNLYGRSALYAAVTYFKKNHLLSYRIGKEEFEASKVWLDALKKWCAERKISFGIVYIPRREEIARSEHPAMTSSFLKDYTEKNNIPRLDLWELFNKDTDFRSYYFPLDTHLSLKGNQKVADYLLDFVRRL